MNNQVRKPKETTEWLNRIIIHPLSYRVTSALLYSQITPNQLSFLGLISSIIGSYFLYLSSINYKYVIATLLCFFFRMIADASDGQLARSKRICSDSGATLDGICDYISFVFIYLALLYSSHHLYGNTVIIYVLLSAISAIFQATTYQFYLDVYNLINYQRVGIKLKTLKHSKSILFKIYNTAQNLFIYPDLLFAINHSEPQLIDNQRLREKLPLWHLLGHNYRYIIVCFLIKYIIIYFLIEIIVLNILLLYLTSNSYCYNNSVDPVLDNNLFFTD